MARASNRTTLRVLLVCTANQCRSPMAAALFRALAADAGVDVEVSSAAAGRLPVGVPATADAVAELASRGIDLAEHRSQPLTAELVEAADLVIAMTRDHARAAVQLGPAAIGRVFTLRDLADRAPRRQAGEAAAAWVARIAPLERHARLVGIGDDGIDDPIGRGPAAYRDCANDLHRLLARVVRAYAG